MDHEGLVFSRNTSLNMPLLFSESNPRSHYLWWMFDPKQGKWTSWGIFWPSICTILLFFLTILLNLHSTYLAFVLLILNHLNFKASHHVSILGHISSLVLTDTLTNNMQCGTSSWRCLVISTITNERDKRPTVDLSCEPMVIRNVVFPLQLFSPKLVFHHTNF